MSIDSTEFITTSKQPHPGEFLEEILIEKKIKKVDFALRCGRASKTISEIISGKSPITPETALQFEHVLGISAQTWLRLETTYQLQKAKTLHSTDLVNAEPWARNFPVEEMITKHFIESVNGKIERITALLRFFSVSSEPAWENFWKDRFANAKFKKHPSKELNRYTISVWLRKAEVLAQKIECNSYNESEFKIALQNIRSLTRNEWEIAQPQLVETCKNIGVAVVFVPNLTHLGMRGCAFWASKDKAIIALSDRGKSAHQLWFSFFHEAAHILLHSKKAIFLDPDRTGSEYSNIEEEADDFSANTIISKKELGIFYERYGQKKDSYKREMLESYSKEINIHSSLLLARLQADGKIKYGSSMQKAFNKRIEFTL